MPTTSTLQPDRYTRGDTGDFRQVDSSSNDNAVLGWQGGIVYRSVAASTAHTSTTTEALFDTGQFSIPANTLAAGDIITVQYWGIATATTNTDTLTIKLYLGGLGGTAICTGTATDIADNVVFSGEAQIQIRTIGASGTFVARATHNKVPAASLTATEVIQTTNSTTLNTTTAQVIGLGADWSTTDVNNSCRLDMFVVRIN